MKSILALLALLLAGQLANAADAVASSAASLDENGVPTREDLVMVEAKAEVTAIDYESRQVTLKGDMGNTVTITAGPQVERLSEVEVGDTVVTKYYISMVYELRAPTEAELREPLTVLAAGAKAGKDSSPAGAEMTQIRAVCTIEALNRPAMSAILKGPAGALHMVKVHNADVFPALRIGQNVVVTLSEALAVELEKAPTNDS